MPSSRDLRHVETVPPGDAAAVDPSLHREHYYHREAYPRIAPMHC
jgi:hypothetical protein